MTGSLDGMKNTNRMARNVYMELSRVKPNRLLVLLAYIIMSIGSASAADRIDYRPPSGGGGSTPGGSFFQAQYNNNGAFGGFGNFNGTNKFTMIGSGSGSDRHGYVCVSSNAGGGDDGTVCLMQQYGTTFLALRADLSTPAAVRAAAFTPYAGSASWSYAADPYNTSIGAPGTSWGAPMNGANDVIQPLAASKVAVKTYDLSIAADQNDWAPTFDYSHGGGAGIIRLSTDASRTITGYVSGGVARANGEVVRFVNVGANDFVIANQSASSTAANRFLNVSGANYTVTPNGEVECWYDGTTTRWRCHKEQ